MDIAVGNDGVPLNSENYAQTAKTRIMRKKFLKDEEISSPVLGLRILPRTLSPAEEKPSHGERNPSATPSLPAFTCKLCQSSFADPVKLASHPCSRIQNVRYHCPECGKSFNCPANLASHRRWHKPKDKPLEEKQPVSRPSPPEDCKGIALPDQEKMSVLNSSHGMKSCGRSHFTCDDSGKTFRRKSYLLQHVETKHSQSSAINKRQKVISPGATPPPPPYETHCQKLKNPTMSSSSESRFDGLAALAYAAEVHSRLFAKFEYVNVPTVKRDSRKRAAQDWNDLIPSKSFNQQPDELSKSNFWLPPSPPRSDLSASPLSVASDDARPTKSTELDARASPNSHLNITSAVYQVNECLSSMNKVSNHVGGMKAIGLKQGLQLAGLSTTRCNAAAQDFGWRLLKQTPIWNPMYI